MYTTACSCSLQEGGVKHILLSLTVGAVSVRGGFFGRGTEDTNYLVVCEGSETELLNCSNRIRLCFSSGAGVICPSESLFAEWSLPGNH